MFSIPKSIAAPERLKVPKWFIWFKRALLNLLDPSIESEMNPKWIIQFFLGIEKIKTKKFPHQLLPLPSLIKLIFAFLQTALSWTVIRGIRWLEKNEANLKLVGNRFRNLLEILITFFSLFQIEKTVWPLWSWSAANSDLDEFERTTGLFKEQSCKSHLVMDPYHGFRRASK